MDDREAVAIGEVVGEYVGTVTGYQPAVQAARVRLRAPVPVGASVCISGEGTEFIEELRPARGSRPRRHVVPANRDVLIEVHQPVEAGAEVFRLW